MAHSFLVKETLCVKPKETSSGERVRLTRMDRMTPTQPVPFISIFGYKIDQHALVESLAKVLVTIPILAGSVCQVTSQVYEEYERSEQEGEESVSMIKTVKGIHLDDTGVEFIVAETDATIDDIDFGYKKPVWSLPLLNIPSKFVTSITVTTLKPTADGREGTIIGVAIDHHIVDAHSMCYFVNRWAEECKGVKTLPEPNHDRHIWDELRSEDPSVVPQAVSRWYSPEEMTSMFAEYGNRCAGAVSEVIDFSFEGLARLKKDAYPSEGWISTHDALIALIWQNIVKIKEDVKDEDMAIFASAANCRKRMEEHVSPNFWGNGVLYTKAEFPAKIVRESPLSVLAKEMRDSLTRMTGSVVRAQIERLREFEFKGLDIKGVTLNVKFGYDLALTSWYGYPLYASDFGGGKPVWVGPSARIIPGLVRILPMAEEKGLRVVLYFFASEIEAFREKILPEFNKYL